MKTLNNFIKQALLCSVGIATAVSMAFSVSKPVPVKAVERTTTNGGQSISDYFEDRNYTTSGIRSAATAKFTVLNNQIKLKKNYTNMYDSSHPKSTVATIAMDTIDSKSISGDFLRYTISNAFSYSGGKLDIVFTMSNLTVKTDARDEHGTNIGNPGGVNKKTGYTKDSYLKEAIIAYSDNGVKGFCVSAAVGEEGPKFDGGRVYASMDVSMKLVDSSTGKTIANKDAPSFLWNFSDIDIGDQFSSFDNDYRGNTQYFEQVGLDDSDFTGKYGEILQGNTWLVKRQDGGTTWYRNGHGQEHDENDTAGATSVSGHLSETSTASVKWKGSGCGTYISGIRVLKRANISISLNKTVDVDPTKAGNQTKVSDDNMKAGLKAYYKYKVTNTGKATLDNVNIYFDSQAVGKTKHAFFSPNDLTITDSPDEKSKNNTKNKASTNPNGSGFKLKPGHSAILEYTLTLSADDITLITGKKVKNSAKVIGFDTETGDSVNDQDDASFSGTIPPRNSALVRVIKKDAGTGENVAISSAKFRIYDDLNGNGILDDDDTANTTVITNSAGAFENYNDNEMFANIGNNPTHGGDNGANGSDPFGTALTDTQFDAGNYILKEMGAPWRYSFNPSGRTVAFSITQEEIDSVKLPDHFIKEVSLSNPEVFGSVIIHKQERDNEKYIFDNDFTSLSGNKFRLISSNNKYRADSVYKDADGHWKGILTYATNQPFSSNGTTEFTTDANGDVTISNVPLGYWRVEETAVGDGFIAGHVSYDPGADLLISNANDPHIYTVDPIDIIAENPPTVTRIRKIDVITKKPLAGAVFQVLDGGSEICRFTSSTDNDGWYTIGGLKEGKTYTLRELSAPTYYVATKTDTPFTVGSSVEVRSDGKEDGLPLNLEINNEPEKCIITVKKRINANDVWLSDRAETAHGDPTFIVKITGTDFYGSNVEYEVPFTFTYDEIKSRKGTANPYLTKSQNVEVRHGTYSTSEMSVSRYKYENMFDLHNASDNGYGAAWIDLMHGAKDATVGYYNSHTRYDKWSHKKIIVNDFTSNYTNDGPYGRPWAGSHGTGTLS